MEEREGKGESAATNATLGWVEKNTQVKQSTLYGIENKVLVRMAAAKLLTKKLVDTKLDLGVRRKRKKYKYRRTFRRNGHINGYKLGVTLCPFPLVEPHGRILFILGKRTA